MHLSCNNRGDLTFCSNVWSNIPCFRSLSYSKEMKMLLCWHSLLLKYLLSLVWSVLKDVNKKYLQYFNSVKFVNKQFSGMQTFHTLNGIIYKAFPIMKYYILTFDHKKLIIHSNIKIPRVIPPSWNLWTSWWRSDYRTSPKNRSNCPHVSRAKKNSCSNVFTLGLSSSTKIPTQGTASVVKSPIVVISV